MKIITVASHLEEQGLDNLVMSAQKFGWDIEVIHTPWRGFGTKLIETYNYFKQNPDVKELIFVDAYDVLILSTPKEVEEKIQDRSKMLVSTEKACWPQSDLASKYPETRNEWKYVNSGTYFAPREVFMQLFESNPPQYESDDQLWLSLMFLGNRGKINLDYNCEVFQCYSFIAKDDFSYDNNRVHNLKTGSKPIFLHGNGKTNMDKVIELL
jgi:hypothetical protein